jgi:hypothetical protein
MQSLLRLLFPSELPAVLWLPCLVLLTVVAAILMGTFLTLPPGPLCDEGMVLFMEGGCSCSLRGSPGL